MQKKKKYKMASGLQVLVYQMTIVSRDQMVSTFYKHIASSFLRTNNPAQDIESFLGLGIV